MAGYHLEPLSNGNSHEWDAFNNTSPEGTTFHSLAWKSIVERHSPQRARYFLLFNESEVTGILPFIEHDVPFLRGFVPPTNPQQLSAILKEYHDPLAAGSAVDGLKRTGSGGRGPSYVCISSPHEETLDAIAHLPLFPWGEGGDMVLDLVERPPEAVWSSLSSKKRKMLHRFERDGFTISEVQSIEDLHRFYRGYEENIRHIGGTLRPFSFFLDQWNTMPGELRITLLSKGPIDAGGLLVHRDDRRKKVYTTYLALNRDLPNQYSPSYYLWWEALCWARENHFEKVSFGSQRLDEQNPRYRVKYSLGARFEPVHSRMLPLTPSFCMILKARRRMERWRTAARGATPGSAGAEGRASVARYLSPPFDIVEEPPCSPRRSRSVRPAPTAGPALRARPGSP